MRARRPFIGSWRSPHTFLADDGLYHLEDPISSFEWSSDDTVWRPVTIVSNDLTRSSHGDVRYNHLRPTMLPSLAYLSPSQKVR